MNDIPIGSIWTCRTHRTNRMVLSCVDAHDPPTGLKMIQYHLMQENRTSVVLSYVGEWLHTYELLAE